jgi:iron complex outermembrane recepter protein
MKFKSWLSLIVSMLFIIGGWTEAAEEVEQPDFQVYTLGEMVITAEKPVTDEVAITNVMTAEEITATNSRTAAEALQYVPGVDVTYDRKNEPEVYIHGFDQSRILVLIDGVPYYETNYGKLNLNQIPSDIIAEIVVTKGAPSVLYGANALAGVINIITKEPTEKPAASAAVEIGEKRYNREVISHGMKVGIFNYWLNYTHSERDAWKLSDDFTPVMGTTVNKPGENTTSIIEDGGFRDNSDSKTDNFWAKIGIEPNQDSEYYINFHLINSEFGMPPSIDENRVINFRPSFSQYGRFKDYDDWGVDLTGRQQIIDQLALKVNLFYHNHKDNYVSYSDQYYNTQIASSTYKDYFIGGSFFADYEVVDWNTLRMALHYRLDSHEDRDDSYLPFAESRSYTGTVAIEDEINPIENLSIIAGLGYNWFDIDKAEETETDRDGYFIEQVELDTPEIKDVFSPMIGATYSLRDLTRLFASVAKTTRFPTLNQLYSGSSGNPDLEAEQSINYTLGVARPFFDILRAELAFFHHDVSDWISRDGPDIDGTYQNWAEVEMYGLEFTAEVNPLEDLVFRIGYTYNHARDTSSDRVTSKLTNVPENLVSAGVQYIIPDIETKLDLTATYMDKIYSRVPTPQDPDLDVLEAGGHFLMNGRITQPFAEYFEGYIAVNNIFDLDYESEYGFPGRGRMAYLGAKAQY